MVRSHLEACELGDRRAVVVPSGAGVAAELIWGERNPNDEVILLVPSSLTNSPWIHMRVHTALSALQRSAQPLRMMAAPSVAQAADDLRAEPINLQAIHAHTVVTLLTGAVLVEALAPTFSCSTRSRTRRKSAAWRRGLVATADDRWRRSPQNACPQAWRIWPSVRARSACSAMQRSLRLLGAPTWPQDRTAERGGGSTDIRQRSFVRFRSAPITQPRFAGCRLHPPRDQAIRAHASERTRHWAAGGHCRDPRP